MQTRSSDEISVCPSVCPSVCLSVKRVHCDKTEEKSAQIFYTIRKNILSSFLRRTMVGGGRPLLPEILGQLARVGEKSPILNQ